MKSRIALVGLTLALTLAACGKGTRGVPGSGIEATEIRQIDAFERIELVGSGRLTIEVGQAAPLTITADDNLLPLLETRVSDGQLVIRPTESISPEIGLVFSVGTESLSGISLTGAASIVAGEVEAQSLEISIEGAGRVKVTGTADTLVAGVAGAGELELFDLQAREAKIDLAGAAGAEVHADELLNVTIAGIGRVRYSGEPKLEKSISGLGSVKRR